jgi:hypothetical protein
VGRNKRKMHPRKRADVATIAYTWRLTWRNVALGGLVAAYLPLEPKFARSNLVKEMGFSRAIKIRSTTSSGGAVKPSVHVVRFYGMLQIPTEYERDNTSQQN